MGLNLDLPGPFPSDREVEGEAEAEVLTDAEDDRLVAMEAGGEGVDDRECWQNGLLSSWVILYTRTFCGRRNLGLVGASKPVESSSKACRSDATT